MQQAGSSWQCKDGHCEAYWSTFAPCRRHLLNPTAEIAVMMQLTEKPCWPMGRLAELSLTVGDMKDKLGLHTDAHRLWQQAELLAQQDCQAMGLKERQVCSPCKV